jgi:hypothetical protein
MSKDDRTKAINTLHGAYSSTIQQRYSDRRTTEGKRLHAVISALVDDLGGPEALSAGQQVLIADLRAKLIVEFQIGDYLDRQMDVIDDDGNILPVLKNVYLGYSESVRRTLEALYGLSNSRLKFRRQVPKLAEIIGKDK